MAYEQYEIARVEIVRLADEPADESYLVITTNAQGHVFAEKTSRHGAVDIVKAYLT